MTRLRKSKVSTGKPRKIGSPYVRRTATKKDINCKLLNDLSEKERM